MTSQQDEIESHPLLGGKAMSERYPEIHTSYVHTALVSGARTMSEIREATGLGLREAVRAFQKLHEAGRAACEPSETSANDRYFPVAQPERVVFEFDGRGLADPIRVCGECRHWNGGERCEAPAPMWVSELDQLEATVHASDVADECECFTAREVEG